MLFLKNEKKNEKFSVQFVSPSCLFFALNEVFFSVFLHITHFIFLLVFCV